MGSYTFLTINGYPLIETKGTIVPEAMTIFRESDRQVLSRKVAQRNPLLWVIEPGTEQEEETAVLYKSDSTVVVDRLGAMGFTLSRVRNEFEDGRSTAVAELREWKSTYGGDGWVDQELDRLSGLSFDKYLEALRQVINETLRPSPFDDDKRPGLSPAVRYILDSEHDYEFGLFAADIRCLIRAACEVVPPRSEIIQDLTELVEAGIYGKYQALCEETIDALASSHLGNANTIVLTEGPTDAQVLKSALRILYPHLGEYYSFLDFDGARVAGGAGQLVTLVKALAGAGIGNRIVALFDNDSAARDAVRSLELIQLPANIAIRMYPNIEMLNSYPTLGPSGPTNLNVNGLAGSIELYFGADILQQSDGALTPVQWRGYIPSLSSYQGEVLRKAELQEAFVRKVIAAERNPSARSQQDWSGMDAILKEIFHAFES